MVHGGRQRKSEIEGPVGGPSVKRKFPFVCISTRVFKSCTWNLLTMPVLWFWGRRRDGEAYFEGRGRPAHRGPPFPKPPGQAVLRPELATWVPAKALNMGLEGHADSTFLRLPSRITKPRARPSSPSLLGTIRAAAAGACPTARRPAGSSRRASNPGRS